MKKMTLALFLFTIPALADEVVVYSSVDDVFARPVAELFELKTKIKVKLVPDTEETKSTGLLNRLIAEKNRPQADVFWSGDPVRTAILKSKGITQIYRSPQSRDLPKIYSDPEGHWIGFSARARVLLYNKDALGSLPKPSSLQDLTKPEFKGKVCIANPLFGTTSMHAAALFESMGEKKAKDFFHALTANQVKVVSSNGEVRRRVSSGDCTVGVTDTDDAAEAVREKKPVEVVFPDEKGSGTLIVPNAVVMIKGAPNVENAKKFIDFLLSPEVEKFLAESDAAQMPVRMGVETPSHVRPLNKITPLKVNYAKLGSRLETISANFLKDWVNKNTK